MDRPSLCKGEITELGGMILSESASSWLSFQRKTNLHIIHVLVLLYWLCLQALFLYNVKTPFGQIQTCYKNQCINRPIHSKLVHKSHWTHLSCIKSLLYTYWPVPSIYWQENGEEQFWCYWHFQYVNLSFPWHYSNFAM